MKPVKSARLPMLLTIIWWVAIWVVSSLPADELPTVDEVGVDKLAHVGVYFILGILLDTWLRRKGLTLKQRLGVFALAVISAFADEYHQHFIPGRSVSIWDFVANASGLVLAWLWRFIRHDKSKRPQH
ncbi:MAG: VanZ family protein [Candidatus Cloacimonetes bacterium]|nr:VanZ family protein [Candidatus Cloacimonadota bacterium]